MEKKAGNPNLNLKKPINKTVIRNLREQSGKPIILEIDDCLHRLCLDEDLFLGKRLVARLRAEQDWFESLVQHPPSVGTFYENALRTLISELLQVQLKAGTGFIFDVDGRNHSRQLDILIYDHSKDAPLYQKGEFAVISPTISVSQSEVKKSLKIADIRSIINSTFTSYFGDHPKDPSGCHRIAVFAYKSPVKTNRIFETIVEEITKLIGEFQTETVSGDKVKLPVHSTVLPYFYFFDRNVYFETRLSINGANCFEITVYEFASSDDNSLNEYLNQMTRSFRRDAEWERDFRTLPIRNVTREKTISPSLFLVKNIPVLEILDRFPDDAQPIKSFRVEGQRPYEAVINAGTKLSAIGNFEDFKKVVTAWNCWDGQGT